MKRSKRTPSGSPKQRSGPRQKRFNKDKAADPRIRLNKFIANAGVCSRREADMLIQNGAIKVNGTVVTELGTKVMPTDKVFYGDQKLVNEKKIYVLLNKPKDCITTVDDPRKRNTVLHILANAFSERLYPVGRLDRNTTGLLLLTNDGVLTKKLTHPSHGIKKLYHVHLDKSLKAGDMLRIAQGISLDGEKVLPDRIEYANPNNKKEVGIELHSGQNRVVRRMFEQLGYKVVKLDRVMFAGLTKKDLPRGKWRQLSEKEITYLKIFA